jgi:hypothetical protein
MSALFKKMLLLGAAVVVGASFAFAQTAAPARAQAKTCPHFAGKWSSDFGPMVLKATPIKNHPGAYTVSGTYYWSGRYQRITGTLSGSNLYGRWIQSDRWGYLSMVLSPDKTGFGGTWTEANKTGGGRWNGNCTG